MSQRSRLLLIFLFSLTVLLFFQNTDIFADPDSFYHAGVARLMAQGDVAVREFPWLPYSILSENYIDHHYLYHAALVPFSFVDPLKGIKIATALFGALFIAFFARMLFSLGVVYPELFVALLVINQPFMFRANLAKASTFSLLFLFSALFALIKKRTFAVFLIAFLYVWAYDGWVLLGGVLGLWWLVHSFGEMVYERNTVSLRFFWRILWSREERTMFLSGVGGLLAGIVVNPFFPKNLSFYYDHIVKIGLVGYKNAIAVGGEWYGYNPFLFLGNNAVLLAVLVLALAVFVVSLRRQGSVSLVALFLSIAFVGATLKSQRNIEYAVPFLVFFCALSFRWVSGEWLWGKIREYSGRWGWLVFGYGVAFALVFSVTKDMILLRRELVSGFRMDFLQQESRWIAEHVKPGEIIFHSNWDEFPPLFYYNPRNEYIAGLDPAFMYAHDPNAYILWRDITQGKVSQGLEELIQREFHTSTVIASQNHKNLQTNLLASGFTKVYEGRDASIFQTHSK